MADIRLITILPPQTVTGVQQPQVFSGSTSGTIQVASLPPGTVLSGFIINRDAGGNPILRTEKGDIAFVSNFFLKIGSEVTIRVENTAGNILAHILSVDGQPPEVAAAKSSFSEEPNIILSKNAAPQPLPLNAQPSAAQAATPAASLPQVPRFTAILVTPLPPQPGQPAPLPAGTQFSFSITNVALPATTDHAPPQAVTSSSAPANPVSYATYAKAANAPASLLATPVANETPITQLSAALQSAGTVEGAGQLPKTLVAGSVSPPTIPLPFPSNPASPPPATTSIPPQQPSALPLAPTSSGTASLPPTTGTNATVPAPLPTIASAPQAQSVSIQPGTTITATVINSEPAGNALIQTSAGIIRLQTPLPLPAGSSITLEVAGIVEQPRHPVAIANIAAANPTLQTPVTQLARQWNSLQDIFSLLAGRPTSTGLDTTAQTQLPTGHSITTGLMAFLAAMKNTDFRSWLGKDNARWLDESGQEGLMKKAVGEFMSMARQFSEAQPHHWQPLFFPVAVEGQIQQLRLFVKRDRKEKQGNEASDKTEETRFVLEVDLSQLGELQMDGFIRAKDKTLQFDLMIRSHTPLSQEVQQDILRIYNDTGAITGYKGSLGFQAMKDFPVNPMEEVAKHSLGNVTA